MLSRVDGHQTSILRSEAGLFPPIRTAQGRTILVKDRQGGAELVLLYPEHGHRGFIHTDPGAPIFSKSFAVFSPDQKLALVAPGNGKLVAYDGATFEKIADLFTEPAPPFGATFSQDGMNFAVSYWTTNRIPVVTREFGIRESAIKRLNKRHNCVRVFDTKNLKSIYHSGKPSFGMSARQNTGLAFHPNGNWLAATTSEGVRIWDWRKKGIDSKRRSVSGRPELRFSRDGSTLAVMGNGVAILETASRRVIKRLKVASPYITACHLSHDETVVIGLDNGAIRVWDFETGKIKQRFGGDDDRLKAFRVTLDDRLIAATDKNRLIRIFGVNDGESKATLGPFSGGVSDFSCSPDGTMIAIVDENGSWYLHSLPSGGLLAKVNSPSARAKRVVFSRGSSNILAFGQRGHVSIWPTTMKGLLDQASTIE